MTIALPPESAAAYSQRKGGTIASFTFADDGTAASPDQMVVEAGVWTVRKQIEAFVNDATLEWKAGRSKATIGVYATHYSSKDRWNIGNDLLTFPVPATAGTYNPSVSANFTYDNSSTCSQTGSGAV